MKLLRLSILALAILLLACCAASAETVASGEIEDGGIWLLDGEGVMTFADTTYVGYMDIPWEVQQTVTLVHFGSEIEEIEGGAFSYFYGLQGFTVDAGNPDFTAVEGVLYTKDMDVLLCFPCGKQIDAFAVPDGVRVIGPDAFVAAKMSQITFPDSLQTVCSQAFWGCENLTQIEIPAGVTSIDETAFTRCMNVESFVVAEGNPIYFTDDEGVLFYRRGSGDKSVTVLLLHPIANTDDYTVPEGVDLLAPYSFMCNEMQAVVVSEGVTSISTCAFESSSIQQITFPASLEQIDLDAFTHCDDLATVYFNGSQEAWAGVGIDNGNVHLQFLTVHCSDGDLEPGPIEGSIGDDITYALTPAGLLTVTGAGEWDYWAFRSNNYIKQVVLQSGVTEIGWGGFAWCESLQEITIPDGVTEIMYEAFYYDQKLRSITIPASVTAIGEEAFDGTGLRTINFGGTMAQWNAMVESPEDCGTQYARVVCSDGEIEPTEEADDYCGDYACYEVEEDEDGGLTLYIFGEGMIYDAFFEGWEGITTLVIHKDVSGICEAAFRNMTDLTEVQLDDSVSYIGENAFDGCENLADVYYMGTAEEWADICFEDGNDPLLEADISFVGGGLPVMKNMTLPDDLVEIDDYAFAGCAAENVLIPDSCWRIGVGAFKDCASLQVIFIPPSVTEIGEDAFDGCPDLLIFAYAESCAAKYAEDNEINYTILSDE